MFLCNGGKGYKGEFVYIRDDREEGVGVEYFSLCEVRVFGLQGNDPFPRGIIVRIERVNLLLNLKMHCKTQQALLSSLLKHLQL